MSIELEYDEGGNGWWPASCIKLKEQTPVE